MVDTVSTIVLGESVRLHVIKTEKFKTNLISAYMQRPLVKEEVTQNALLSMVLPRGTKSYLTTKEIAKTLENLYGASIGCDVSKKGERNILHFRMQLVNDIYIEEQNVFQKGLKILNEFMKEPLLQDNGFKREYITQEKANLAERIEGRKNDKMRYGYDRCIEEMCKNENFSLYEYGSLEELNPISGKSLYEHYMNVMNTSPVDICVVGNLNIELVKEMLLENLKLKVSQPMEIPREKIEYDVKKVHYVTEEMDVNQGKLTMGYRTSVPYESELYEPLVIFSNILGGGPHSKLFNNIREKESLCYYIFSRIEKFKSLMLISSGIEFANYEKTVDLIGKQLKGMINGEISPEEIESSKNSIITSLRAMTDSPAMLADFYYTQIISNNKDSIEGIIEKIRRVEKEAIVEAGKNIQLDTIYFLKNKEEGK